MADDVNLPIAAPTTVATDDVGAGRQVQLVKLVDGRGGSSIPLNVGPSGAADTGQPFLQVADIVADASQIAYTAGQLFGSVITLKADVPTGLYLVDEFLVVDITGAALPGLDLVIYSDSDSAPISGTADGDTFTPSGFSATAAVGIKAASADLATGGHAFFPDAGIWLPSPPMPWRVMNADHPTNAMVDVKAVLVTTGTVASPTGGPFAIAVIARQVGATSLG